MRIAETAGEIREISRSRKGLGEKVAFVPTMGCLHEGHLSLLRKARALGDFVVASIFVNPMQFGPNEDYERYPRTFEKDARLCEENGVGALFHPSVSEMYGEGFSTFVEVSGPVSEILCGASRPGHFRGVATVVTKLFNAVEPDAAVFGQKDAQQAFLVRKMARELGMPVEIHIAPTVRESDGLAMSSRNNYLSPEERAAAPLIMKALDRAAEEFAGGEMRASELKKAVTGVIGSSPLFRIDYVEMVDTSDFTPAERVDGHCLLAVAAFLGGTRLIDNILLGAEK